MSWFLQIGIPRSKYKAGDTVSGSVRLVSEHPKGQEIDVGSITIEFIGRSTTAKHWPRNPNNIRLFSFKAILFTGPRKLYVPHGQTSNVDRNEWPFSFTLPLDCTLSQSYSAITSPHFNSDPNQPLPISFMDNSQYGSCSILYELQAILASPLRDGYYTNKSCTKKVEISVYMPRNIEQPQFSFNDKRVEFTYRSLLLLPREERELVHRPLTIKEKLRLKPPSTEHLPKAVFAIRVQTPSVAVIGRPLPIMLYVDYNANASTVPPPIFHLKRVSIHLCEVNSIWSLTSTGEPISTRWTKEVTLQEQDFEIRRPRVEERLDLRKVMDTLVNRDLPPTFKTFNITRAYLLKVYVRLESTGKVHLVFGDYKRCTLLAEEYDSQITVYNEPAPILDEEEIDPPPPYHFVTQEAVPEYATQARHTGHLGHSHARRNEAALLGANETSTAATTQFE